MQKKCRVKPAEWTEEEKLRYEADLASRGNESSYTDACAELVSAVVNHAVIDLLSPPVTTSAAISHRNHQTKKSHLLRKQEYDRNDARRFIESDDLNTYLAFIKVLGRSGANASVIRKLCKEYEASGKYLYISMSCANVMTADEWVSYQMDNYNSKFKGSAKKGLKASLKAQESSDVETVEVPLSSDRLAA